MPGRRHAILHRHAVLGRSVTHLSKPHASERDVFRELLRVVKLYVQPVLDHQHSVLCNKIFIETPLNFIILRTHGTNKVLLEDWDIILIFIKFHCFGNQILIAKCLPARKPTDPTAWTSSINSPKTPKTGQKRLKTVYGVGAAFSG